MTSLIDPTWRLFYAEQKLKELETNLSTATKALQTIVDMAEDPLASDNPHIHAYLTTAKIAKQAINDIKENTNEPK